MNRRVLRLGAIIGAATVTTLAVAPAFAAAPVSQSSAQSLELQIAGNKVVSQQASATNDGSTENVVEDNTLPSLAGLIPGNNALNAAVGVQKAQANSDGTSFACAGIAGTGADGGALVTVGNKECSLNGSPLTLDLGSLDLDIDNLLGGKGAITEALNGPLSPVLGPVTGALNTVLTELTNGLAATPLGEIGVSGGLSVVEAACTANPDAAQGKAEIADTSGDHTIPITLHLPNNTNLVVANLDVSHPAKPGGTKVILNLKDVTASILAAVKIQLDTMLQGQIAAISDPLWKSLVTPLQTQLLNVLFDQLKPLLEAVSNNILELTINDVTPGDGGRSVSVTTLGIEVLPAAKEFTGNALISGTIGHVTCGPNNRVTTPPTTGNPESPQNPEGPETPTVVASGVAGQGDHTARNILLATGALMLLAGSAGLLGFRRSLLNK